MSDLSNRQFYTENKLLSQGNMDELSTRVRGFQHLTSNIYRPSFSADYTNVQSMKSPAAAQQQQGGEQEEEE
jgi:hypothetical protein